MDEQQPTDTAVVRKPYTTPALREFGTVAAITQTLSKAGQQKDGGPNNLKT